MTQTFRFARRHLLMALVGMAVAGPLAAQAPATASSWPDRSIKLVIPFPAGSVSDRIGRVLAQRLEASLKQTVVVENRPGAGATIGSDHAARQKPDGYTLLLGANASHAVNVAFMKLNYDPIKSFEPISLVAAVPSVLAVQPALPVKSVSELVALAKSKPQGITYTSAGMGTTGHIGMEMFASMTDTKYTHVPEKGPGAALTSVLGGHMDLFIESIAMTAPQVKAGKLRALAVTSQTRSPALPDTPTLAEAGVPGYELLLWFGLYAPAGTPQPIISRLHAETERIFADPEVRDPLVRDGVTVIASSPQRLAEFQQSEITKFGELIRKLGLKLN